MGELQTFESLACYEHARELRKSVSIFCRTLPGEEKYRLKDQIIRSSRSITANIAEGYGRHHHQENLQFCRTARGSLSETLEHFNTALDEGYLREEQYQLFRRQIAETWKILNGYIGYLKKCNTSGIPAAKQRNDKS
jgi:four helix bundle protein